MTKILRTLTIPAVFSAAALLFSSCTSPEPETEEFRKQQSSRPAGEEPLSSSGNEKTEQEIQDQQSPNHRTLYEASRKGDIEDVQLHLRQGADVNTTDERNNFTPLHYASWEGHTEIAELLIYRGADIEARTNMNDTPIFSASGNGDIEIAKLLLDYGADIHARDEIGLTSSGATAKLDYPELASLLNQYDKTK